MGQADNMTSYLCISKAWQNYAYSKKASYIS